MLIYAAFISMEYPVMQTKKDLSQSSNNGQHNFFDAFSNLEHKIENMFTHIWHKPHDKEEKDSPSFSEKFNNAPKIDIIDRDKEIFIKAELPGINKEDIDITLSNNRLLIKASSLHEYKKEEGDYLKQEIRSSEIYRTILLPTDVDDSKIKTTFINGILELTIAKHENSHRRHIKIE